MVLNGALQKGLLTELLLGCAHGARAAGKPMEIVVSAPGPRNLTYLAVDLVSKIGTDLTLGREKG